VPCSFECDPEAMKWYRLAAEQGYAEAQNNIGSMYKKGKGVLQDNVLVHIWYNIA
jgi:TPR repeat protein